MKKRKIKLLSTVAAMAMVLGVMGVGVYAATSQSLAITTTVSFTAKDCQVQVTALATGDYISTASFSAGTGATFTTADAKTASVTLYDSYAATKIMPSSLNLALTLTDNNVGYIPSSTTIGTITYTITNGSSDTLYLKTLDLAIASAVSSNISVSVAYDTTTATNHFTAVDGKKGYSLATGAYSTVTVTFTSGSSNITEGISASTGLFTSGHDMAFNFVNATGQLASQPYNVTYVDSDTSDIFVMNYTGGSTATYGTDYTSTISASGNEDYGASSVASVSITIGGNSYIGFTDNITTDSLNAKTHAITIPGADITGNIVITVTMNVCFVAGTQVWTYDVTNQCDVYKNIEDIVIGDYVYTFNEETNKNELGEVTALKRNNQKVSVYKLVAIDETTNETFEVTGTLTHPIYSLTYSDYIALGDLEVGEILKLANGTAKVVSITLQSEQEYVYNFTVEGNHNYYITENNLLVHNMPESCG